uniref:Uncharacterized protein n=1 Tax=Globodera rostochiensis TaxID=31243 RepID=A0A914HUZ0_GLORO
MQVAKCCLCQMLIPGARRFAIQQSTAVLVSANLVATSSNALMEQYNDKETIKDFGKIMKLIEKHPSLKRKIERKTPAEDNYLFEKKNERKKDWMEYVRNGLHREYDDHAMRKGLESRKKRARREAFCYMRDHNTLELLRNAQNYMNELKGLNEKVNQRIFEDDELFVTVLKFVRKELLKGDEQKND